MIAALPTRRDEDFRYADLAALERVWPVAVQTIALAEGEVRALSLVNTGVQELAVTLAPGARLSLHVLNAGAGYGRIAVRAELHQGDRRPVDKEGEDEQCFLRSG